MTETHVTVIVSFNNYWMMQEIFQFKKKKFVRKTEVDLWHVIVIGMYFECNKIKSQNLVLILANLLYFQKLPRVKS